MNETHGYLVKTLVQRGESDNYILQRLLLAGLQDDDAFRLIRQTRQSTEATYPHIVTETEGLFILIGVIAMLVVLVLLLLPPA